MVEMNFADKSSMDAKWRVEKYAKDEVVEQWLGSLNSSLPTADDILSQSIESKGHPIVLLVSAPRAGSTLFTQLFCSRFQVGYPSNLMARFFNAPLTGAMLQKQLIGDRIKEIRDYTSEYGVTSRIEEPHEFGYFWMKYFSIESDVHEPNSSWTMDPHKLDELNIKLQQITGIFDKPMVYKLPVGVFFLKELSKLDNVFLVTLHREHVANIRSILKTRVARLGTDSRWWSFRTGNYHELQNKSSIEQVIGQYSRIEELISDGLSYWDESRRASISFDALVSDPELELDRIAELIYKCSGTKLSKHGTKLPNLELRNTDDELSREIRSNL